MNLYLISQSENTNCDSYDSAVVCAESSEEAQNIHPDGRTLTKKSWMRASETWCSNPACVEIKWIGSAAPRQKRGVICASFNAG